MLFRKPPSGMGMALAALAASLGVGALGCDGAKGQPKVSQLKPAPATQVVVVAPVLNLSGSSDFDPLKVTDAVASELVSFAGISAVPVNLTLAALARQGKNRVESPAEAAELARAFGAQATLVTAVTEYRPYDPPVIGLIMQWYTASGGAPAAAEAGSTADPAAGQQASELVTRADAGPRTQLQRVFDAADEDVLDEVKKFADERDGHNSPYGWHKYVKSQDLYVRYCCWSLIRSILAVDQPLWAVSGIREAQP
jgi:hypothetical protein